MSNIFKESLDSKFEVIKVQADPIEDAKKDGIISDKKEDERLESTLPDTVTVDYDETKSLLKFITDNNSLSDETLAKVTEYLSNIEVSRISDKANEEFHEMLMKYSGIIEEANIAATKSAAGRFSGFMNTLYGGINILQKNIGIDKFYSDAIHKQSVFVPVMNMMTNFLKNIMSSQDRGKFLLMLQSGQKINPIILAKHMFAVPAKLTVNGKEEIMHVPFTPEFVNSRVSVQLPDYCYKIRPFLAEGMFSYDAETGIKLRKDTNSPFIKQFLQTMVDSKQVDTIIKNTSVNAVGPTVQPTQNVPGSITTTEGLSPALASFIGLLESGIIGKYTLSESINKPEFDELRGRISKITSELVKHEAGLNNILEMRTEITRQNSLVDRRGDTIFIPAKTKELIKHTIETEETLRDNMIETSKEIERIIKELP